MSISAFPDRSQPPSPEAIISVVGSRRALWQSLTSWLEEGYGAREELKYYGKSYGWMVQYRRAGKLLVSLYPKRNGLVAQIVLPEALVETVLEQPLGEKACIAIESANQYSEGRWVFLDVWTEQEVEDVRRMLAAKAPLPRKRATAKDRAPRTSRSEQSA